MNEDHLSYFDFVGRIIAIAVFHGHYIDGGFTTPFYKMLLNKPINLDDIESVDSELHSSLRWILDNDISGVIDHTFSVEHDSFGVVQTHELKKDGKAIQVSVTSSNLCKLDVNTNIQPSVFSTISGHRGQQERVCETLRELQMVPRDRTAVPVIAKGIQ